MKKGKRALALILSLTAVMAPTANTYAQEVQLTDYRYETCMQGLYGYIFGNVSTPGKSGKYVYGDTSIDIDQTGHVVSIDSVILNPDGTEVVQQGKYEISYTSVMSYVDTYSIYFPQYEYLFAAHDRTTGKDCILDKDGNQLYSVDYSGLLFGLLGEIEINGGKYLVIGSTTYEGNRNQYGYYGDVNALIRESDGKVIFNTKVDPHLDPAVLYISSDEKYLKLAGVEKIFSESKGYLVPVDVEYYFDLEGNRIAEPENVEFNRYIDTGGYLEIGPDYVLNTDKVNKNYFFKETTIYGKPFYAVFKELEEGETLEDYLPKEQPSPWAAESIKKATEAGILYNNFNCRYKDNISRQDFAVLVVEAYCRSLGKEVGQYVSENHIGLNFDKFKDNQNAYVMLAYKLGIINGTSDTTFSPDRGITRQEAAVMLNNLAKLAGISPNSARVDFTDKDYFADWAKDAISNVSSIKNSDGVAVMGGTQADKFSPWMTFSREQAYVTVYRLFEMM